MDHQSNSPPADHVEQLEAQLEHYREECKRLRGFVDGAVDYAFVLLNLDNRITGWNEGAERLLGYKEKEILGKPGSIFFTPEDVASGQVGQELNTARTQGSAADERWHMKKDGSRFWGSGTMARLTDSNGVVS